MTLVTCALLKEEVSLATVTSRVRGFAPKRGNRQPETLSSVVFRRGVSCI